MEIHRFAFVCICRESCKVHTHEVEVARVQQLNMNAWYIAAIVLVAAASCCSYYGATVNSRRSSQKNSEQLTRIETQLSNVGKEIHVIQNESAGPATPNKINEVEQKYQEIAKEFFSSLPLRVAERQSQDANQVVQQIQQSREVQARFREIERESREIVNAYNTTAGRTVVEVEVSDFPVNVFDRGQQQQIYILYKFEHAKFWALRFVTYNKRTPALAFSRLVSPDGTSNYKQMRQTGDSIFLILLSDQFQVSRDTNISQPVRQDVLGDLSTAPQPMADFNKTSVALVKRIIEYQLLDTSASAPSVSPPKKP